MSEGLYKGLSESEAQNLFLKYGANELPQARQKNLFIIFLKILVEPTIFILLLCSLTYFFIGTFAEAFFLSLSASIIILVTIVQENRTETALAKLKDLSSPRSHVIRDGVIKLIPSKELVPGDLVKFHEGDRISADGKLLTVNNMMVDESILTGESFPLEKNPSDKFISGSLVVKGDGLGIVELTGNATQIGKIGKSLASIESEKTMLQERMIKLSKQITALAFLLCLIVYFLSVRAGQSYVQSFLSSLAAAIALLPEEFPLVLSVYLSLGAWRLSKVKVLARKANAIENLGAVTVLCVDKTGTLTLNEMKVDQIVGNEIEVLIAANLASESQSPDPMEKAIVKKFEEQKIARANFTLVQSINISKDCLAYRSLYQSQNKLLAFTKGAPETIVSFCQLNDEEKKSIYTELANLATKGYRVLGVAKKEDVEKNSWDSKEGWTWLGLLAFLDPLRIEVPQAVKRCHEAGIKVKMLTGDHPVTAKTIAHSVGLRHFQNVVTGKELETLTYQQVKEQIHNTDVFARMKPEQKLLLVNCLKEEGEHVAMTGDGVNDAPGLKSADVGVAMGMRGADVAREAADIVLLDDNFASLVNAIAEGRRIYSCIQKSFNFLLSVHIMIGLLAVLPLIFGLPILLQPLHLVFLEFVIDPTSSLVFAKEEPGEKIMQVPPRLANEPIFGWKKTFSILFMCLLLVSVLLFLFAYLLKNHSLERSRLIVFLGTLLFTFSFVLKEIRSWHALRWCLGIMGLAFLSIYLILKIPFLSQIFKIG